jgi:DNA polymerase-3 subunit delta'
MINLPEWLETQSAALDTLITKQQFPHALLIHGPEGTGRRPLALWLVGRLLGLRDVDLRPAMVVSSFLEPETMPQHPDFQLVQPEPDKRSISIERVRGLIAFLNLTSHQSGTKVALITPAHSMTHPAANSLLKTLEEPPGNSAIILVAEALSRLPATIVSRCRRVRVPAPAFAEANTWLKRQAPDVEWGPILELAGGAPLSALRLQQSDFSSHADGLKDDISALLERRLTPANVARRWASVDPDLCLQWLYRRISQEIRLGSGIPIGDLQQDAGLGYLQYPSESLNIEASFADLREINELRRLQGAGLNQDLQLTNILGRWYGGARL